MAEERKPKLYATLEFEEDVRIEIPKDLLKEMVEKNPGSEAIEACMAGYWAERWATAVTGITREEAERVPALKEARERAKRRLCERLLKAIT